MAVSIPVGIAGFGAVVGMVYIWPRDPQFEVVNISVSGFKLRFCTDSPLLVAVIDAEMTLSIKVTNKNIVPIQHGETTMDIFYKGTLLGQAKVPAGKQAAQSSKVIDVPARMDGLEVGSHITDLMEDVRTRKMTLKAYTKIAGEARLAFIRHPFQCQVTSEITIDPIYLNIIEQENNVEMKYGVVPKTDMMESEEERKEAEEQGKKNAEGTGEYSSNKEKEGGIFKLAT